MENLFLNDLLADRVETIGENTVFGMNDKTTGDPSIWDDIEAQEEKDVIYGELYTLFMKVTDVLSSPSKYNEIQSVMPTIDTNSNMIKITGVCKGDVKANPQDLSHDDEKNVENTSENIVDLYVRDMIKTVVPDGFTVEYGIEDDKLSGMEKTQFWVSIQSNDKRKKPKGETETSEM